MTGDKSIVLAKIVPADAVGDGPQTVQGTRIYVGDQELKGVTRIEIVAEVGDAWRARIDCMIQPPNELVAVADLRFPPLPSRWQRFRAWLKK